MRGEGESTCTLSFSVLFLIGSTFNKAGRDSIFGQLVAMSYINFGSTGVGKYKQCAGTGGLITQPSTVIITLTLHMYNSHCYSEFNRASTP